MSATLESKDVFGDQYMGLPLKPNGSPSTALLAEFLRASIHALYDGNPVSGRKILGLTEERLSVLFQFRSSLSEHFFAEELLEQSESSRSELVSALFWLTNIGDLVAIKGGYYLPTPTRVIALPKSGYLILSGFPSDRLEQEYGLGKIRGRFARFTESDIPLSSCIHSRLSDWLKLDSESLTDWTKTKLNSPLAAYATDATKWEVANISDQGLRWIPTEEWPDYSGVQVVRFKRENLYGYQRLIARLKRVPGAIACIAANEISLNDCSRILHGVLAMKGGAKRLPYSQSEANFEIRANRYLLPEVALCLAAIAIDQNETEEEITEFTFLKNDLERLNSLIAIFGMKLSPRTI